MIRRDMNLVGSSPCFGSPTVRNRPLPADIATTENPLVWMDVAMRGEVAGRVVMLLRKDVAPRTAENFRALCTGEMGIGRRRKPLHFQGSRFHRAKRQFMVQGGDITAFNGTGGDSIYGLTFEDENFILPHLTAVVSMANSGKPHTNSSQFFITTVECSQLDGTNVVFGDVLKGIGVMLEIQDCKTGEHDRLVEDCVIANCGQFIPGEDWGINDNDITDDKLPPYPQDMDGFNEDTIERMAMKEKFFLIKSSGNIFYEMKKYTAASRKYKKAIRFINWASFNSDDTFYVFESLKKVNPELLELKRDCLINLAASELKLDNHKYVLEVCNEVLVFEPDNVKALFRRGMSHISLNDYDLALRDLTAAEKLCPNDAIIKIELKKFKIVYSKYVAKEKIFYKNMLNLQN